MPSNRDIYCTGGHINMRCVDFTLCLFFMRILNNFLWNLCIYVHKIYRRFKNNKYFINLTKSLKSRKIFSIIWQLNLIRTVYKFDFINEFLYKHNFCILRLYKKIVFSWLYTIAAIMWLNLDNNMDSAL